jgi:hypothetical protein
MGHRCRANLEKSCLSTLLSDGQFWKEADMHADIRTNAISWIVLFGYLAVCGLLWVAR